MRKKELAEAYKRQAAILREIGASPESISIADRLGCLVESEALSEPETNTDRQKVEEFLVGVKETIKRISKSIKRHVRLEKQSTIDREFILLAMVSSMLALADDRTFTDESLTVKDMARDIESRLAQVLDDKVTVTSLGYRGYLPKCGKRMGD